MGDELMLIAFGKFFFDFLFGTVLFNLWQCWIVLNQSDVDLIKRSKYITDRILGFHFWSGNLFPSTKRSFLTCPDLSRPDQPRLDLSWPGLTCPNLSQLVPAYPSPPWPVLTCTDLSRPIPFLTKLGGNMFVCFCLFVISHLLRCWCI